jgi:class 3 adenylate cyclase
MLCSGCGHENVHAAKFCNECGARLTPSSEAERRQLTVMFCDLVESTQLSRRLDPEDLREVVRAYQEAAARAVDRYEGHIAQYLGDGLLVYFGYPKAHEQDAERAVRAGREIIRAINHLNQELLRKHQTELRVRIGIHTGPVVVGEMGAGERRETLALGDTTNIAARLEGAAEPGEVVISETTLRLVPGLFVTKDLGALALKGVEESINAYGVLRPSGVRSRLEASQGRLTPLVGRGQELELLLGRWAKARAGEGQAVLVSGEAGVGKSRLIHAFHQALAGESHSWFECRSTPYSQGSAFFPLIELLERSLGFQEGDNAEKKLRRLEQGVEGSGLHRPEVVPFIAPLLRIPLPDRYPPRQESPALQRKKTIEALVSWLLALAGEQPVVLLIEDLHWCDASTVELLGLLLERSEKYGLLTLLSFRPDFTPPWSERSHVARLALTRLPTTEAEEVIKGAAGDSSLPEALVARIVERADGVPLFLEELTKMVVGSGVLEEKDGRYELSASIADLAIPATLQDSLMARLDQLPDGKPIAQRAAALGREFSYELLAAISPIEGFMPQNGLAELVEAGLLYQRGDIPDATYTFKHAMVQDTAYQSLLKSTRREIHAAIAEALKGKFPERVEAEPEVIARHCDNAGFVDDAISHYKRAGERAARASANQDAVHHFHRALELIALLPETPARDQQELALQLAVASPRVITLGWAAPETKATYLRARWLAERLDDT